MKKPDQKLLWIEVGASFNYDNKVYIKLKGQHPDSKDMCPILDLEDWSVKYLDDFKNVQKVELTF